MCRRLSTSAMLPGRLFGWRRDCEVIARYTHDSCGRTSMFLMFVCDSLLACRFFPRRAHVRVGFVYALVLAGARGGKCDNFEIFLFSFCRGNIMRITGVNILPAGFLFLPGSVWCAYRMAKARTGRCNLLCRWRMLLLAGGGVLSAQYSHGLFAPEIIKSRDCQPAAIFCRQWTGGIKIPKVQWNRQFCLLRRNRGVVVLQLRRRAQRRPKHWHFKTTQKRTTAIFIGLPAVSSATTRSEPNISRSYLFAIPFYYFRRNVRISL